MAAPPSALQTFDPLYDKPYDKPVPRYYEWFFPARTFGKCMWLATHRANATKVTGRERVVLFGDSITEAWSLPMPWPLWRALAIEERQTPLGPGEAGVLKGLVAGLGLVWVWLLCGGWLEVLGFPLGLRGVRVRVLAACLRWCWDFPRPALARLRESCGGPGSVAHMGAGGDRTRHALWRIENGEIDGAVSPSLRAVVVCIGVNNGVWCETEREVVAGKILGVARAVEARTPSTVRVLLCRLLPTDGPAFSAAAAARVNADLAALVDAEKALGGLGRVDLLDFSPCFARAGGSNEPLPALFSAGRVHLRNRGYDAWAIALAAALAPFLRD